MPSSPTTTTTQDDLRARSIPHMTLSSGDASSMTGPPPPMPHYLTSEGRAIRRFAVEGNAICTSTHVSRVTSPFPHPSFQIHLSNKLPYLVTGGAGTLALVNARALLEHGLSGLALFDLDHAKSTDEIEALKADFPSSKILSIKVDVTNAEQLESAVKLTVLELGSVDILCCFAGVVGCTHAIDMSPLEWKSRLDINTTGSFLSAQAAAR